MAAVDLDGAARLFEIAIRLVVDDGPGALFPKGHVDDPFDQDAVVGAHAHRRLAAEFTTLRRLPGARQ